MPKRLNGPMLARAAQVGEIQNAESRLIRVAFSSETPYRRREYFDDDWYEVLGHSDGEVNLDVINSRAPVLLVHQGRSIDSHIGVIERAWLEDERGWADIRISKHGEEADLAWGRINEGVLCNVSVGYNIDELVLVKHEDDGISEYRAIRWTPREISFVPMPADHTVGMGRAHSDAQFSITLKQEESTMPDKAVNDGDTGVVDDTRGTEGTEQQEPAPDFSQTESPAAAPVPAPPVEPAEQRGETAEDSQRGIQEAIDKALAAERQRCSDIRAAVRVGRLPDSRADDMIARNISIERARKEILDDWAKQGPEVSGVVRIAMGDNETDKFRAGMEAALLARSGLAKHDGENEFRGYTLMTFAQRALELNGVRFGQLSKMEMVGRAFTHSTSDFAIILQNVANKAMLKGWEEQEESYQKWTRRGTLPDFKQAKRVDTNLFPSLLEIEEGGEYQSATFGDRGETIQLATYGRIFTITRQAIVNDDLDSFSRIPERMGRAARRTVGNLVYAVVTTNGNLSDGNPLFDATHSNLGTAANINTDSVDELRTIMALQKDPDGHAAGGLNIRPKYLLTPVASEGRARTVAESNVHIGASEVSATIPNSVRGTFEVISDARLDAANAAEWYLAADPNAYDTIEVSYLDGDDTPFMDQQDGWTIDGTSFKVRIDAGVAPLDFRGLAKNPAA